MSKDYQKSFLKWAGGKYRLLDEIFKELPVGDTLIEPFVGSGVVFLNVYDQYKNIIVGDSNPDIINLYQYLKNEGDAFIKDAKTYFDSSNNSASAFYKLRSKFNASIDSRERSLIFIYLNRHCFNGLCRYNSKGEYNVPFGTYKTIYFPENELKEFSLRSQSVTFLCQDFIQILSLAKVNDVVYMDPPYIPLSATSNFSDYSSDGGFGLDKQILLAQQAENLSNAGVHVLISNHDTPISRDLYKNAKSIKSLLVSRMISGSGNRNKAPELLVKY